jgi:hypothetical protein
MQANGSIDFFKESRIILFESLFLSDKIRIFNRCLSNSLELL